MRDYDTTKNSPEALELIRAIVSGDGDRVATLLRAQPDLAEAKLHQQWSCKTPLIAAIESKHLACVQAIVAAGADIESRDEHRFTPLHYAGGYDAAIFQWLLDQGANPRARSRAGATLLSVAKPECVRIAFDVLGPSSLEEPANSGQTPLLACLRNDLAASARELLALGANAAAVDWEGLGAVSACATPRSRALLAELIERGADPHLAPPDKSAPLYDFARQGFTEEALLLISLGCDPNRPGKDGFRPVSQAIFNDDLILAEALVKAGATLNFQDPQGRSLRESLKGAGRAKDETIDYLERVEEAHHIKSSLHAGPQGASLAQRPAARL